jgi:argininosuccinate synthase
MAVDWTWAYELRQVDTTTTRLVLRVRATFDPWWVRLIYDGMIVPSDFVMARSMLRGIARRVEGRPSRADLDEAARRDSARAG